MREHASRKEASAELQLGRCLEQGWSVSKDAKVAAEWYRAAAAHGSNEAPLRLCALYLGRNGVDRDAAAALRFLRQSADAGNAEAEYFVGWCYEYGVLNDRSLLGADEHSVLLVCLQKMIDAPTPGKAALAQLAWSKDCQPVTLPPKAAVDAYARAVDHGSALAALLAVGTCLTTGEGTHMQIQKSLQILSKQDDGAMLGAYEGCRAWLLASIFRDLVPADSPKSMTRLREFAKKGDPEAMDALATFVGSGAEGIAQDEQASEQWRRNAVLARKRQAESGDTVAQYKTA